MTRAGFVCLALLLGLTFSGSALPIVPADFLQLRALDHRMASVANRLVVGNAALCDERMPATGMVIHALQQYAPGARDIARAVFGFESPIAVETVAAGGAAEAADVRAGDGIVAINGVPVAAPDAGGTASSAARDATERQLEKLPPGAPIELSLVRGGKPLTISVHPVPACRTRFEVSTENSTIGQSDGETIQIASDFLQRFDDNALAVIVAHELGHTVLKHRQRLERAGVSKGLLAEFGRNGRLNRRAEDEADILSVSLLRNAGYDPAIGPRFWREQGGRVESALFRGLTHGSPKARAAAMEREIASVPPGAPTPYRPPLLETRDRPFG